MNRKLLKVVALEDVKPLLEAVQWTIKRLESDHHKFDGNEGAKRCLELALAPWADVMKGMK